MQKRRRIDLNVSVLYVLEFVFVKEKKKVVYMRNALKTCHEVYPMGKVLCIHVHQDATQEF